MAIAKIPRKHHGASIYSPFTGMVADGPDGPNESDPSLLFVHYSESGLYAYVSMAVIDHLNGDDATEVEGLTPDELIERLEIPDAFALEVETGAGGVHCYGFVAVDGGTGR